MKAFRIILAIAFVFAALGMAQGAVKAGAFTYTSGIQVQNLESSEASITLTFYKQDGSVDATVTPQDPIAPNDDVTFFPVGANPGFNGSVVISSDKQVAAISNVIGTQGGATASASYVAASSGNTQILIPLLMKNNAGFNTWFNVQNTGQTAASVDVNYSDGTSASATIPPGAAHTFDQAVETHSVAVFSAIVTSDVPVAATVIEENATIMFAYSGFNAGTTNPVLPLINANNANFVTGAQIQNAGNTETSVTVSYTPSTYGTACTETATIAAGQSKTFTLGAFAGSPPAGTTTDCVGGQRFVGSAQVTANSASQPLTVIVNQLGVGTGEAYNGFDASAAGDTVVMPLIMDRNSVFFTGFNVMNVGAAATTVNCTFTGTSYTVGDTLEPGEALNDLQQNKIAAGYVGSGTCTAGAGGQIVGVVNELGAAANSDLLLVYEGIGQ